MIRRSHIDAALGPCTALITQHDHALLSGQIASHLGSSRFPKPEPFTSFQTAVAQHDAGWPAHDDLAPTLNRNGEPLDVFESPLSVALKVWAAAPDRARAAAGNDPMAGWTELLVSVHVLTLSGIAASHHQVEQATRGKPSAFDPAEMAARFDINKFQHREIERQQTLRAALGFPDHIPLTLGLADPGASALDDQLLHHYRWLQALDLMSLAVCCSQAPQGQTPDIPLSSQDTHDTQPLQLTRDGSDLIVRPWPFAVEHLTLAIPAKLLIHQRYNDVDTFRAAYAKASSTVLTATLRPY